MQSADQHIFHKGDPLGGIRGQFFKFNFTHPSRENSFP